jgi:hypothetical protein
VTVRQTLALVVSFSLVCGPAVTMAGAAQGEVEVGPGSIHGTLFQPDGKAPLAGAKVIAINVPTGKQYPSNVTSDVGIYVIDGLSAGAYYVVIEVGGNLFVADNVIDVGPHESVSRSYSVQPERPANRLISKLPPPRGSAIPVGEGKAPAASFWKTPGGIALISVLGAGAAAAIISSVGHKDRGSPSTP